MVDAETVDVHRLHEREGVRVAEVEAFEAFGDHDRVLAVGGEVHVVRVVDGNVRAGLPGRRIDWRQRVAAVVRHVQRLQVPGGDDVLRQDADRELIDHLRGERIDHIDRVTEGIRNVHQGPDVLHDRRERVRAIRGVDVARPVAVAVTAEVDDEAAPGEAPVVGAVDEDGAFAGAVLPAAATARRQQECDDACRARRSTSGSC